MSKKPLAVLVDSTGTDVTRLGVSEHIFMQPLSITFGNRTFTDVTELAPEEFYHLLKTNPSHPTTSQPVLGEVIETLEKLLETYENVLCIALSQHISGTYTGLVQAAEMVDENRVKVIDSKATGPVEWILGEHAIALANEDTPFSEIVSTIQSFVDQCRVFVYIDTLTFLAKSGRLSGAKALVGNLIQMKTNIKFLDGKAEVIGRVRTAKKAIFQMLDAAMDEVTKQTKTLYIGYADSTRPDFIDEIKSYINSKRSDLTIREMIIPAVLGNNSGPGGYGIAYVQGL